jgi:diaminohydroxyphosphoribosylaminopyrimidine deaminase/5-amino-6-(5-phosphoribosylamino)uracil reductase
VDVLPATHPLAVATRELNIGFFSRMERGLPWVRMKVAASLDGTTALANGVSQWITSTEARTDGHAWRRRASALLTGVGTVLADAPRLDVRLVPTQRQPLRVVIDSRLDMPTTARILQPPGEVLVYAALPAPADHGLALVGATVVSLPEAGRDKVDLPAVLRDLAQRGVNELHVEAGHKLNGSFLRAGLVDELLVYLAPKLMGPGAGLAALGPFTAMDQALPWAYTDVAPVGPDLRLRLRLRRA